MSSQHNKYNRSDTNVKNKLKRELELTGRYRNVKITKTPTDIQATTHDGILHYYELKSTSKFKYFGAATTTEWTCAINNPYRFWFVIALDVNNKIEFDFLTPEEFRRISYHRWNPQILFHYNFRTKHIPIDGGIKNDDVIFLTSAFHQLRCIHEGIQEDYCI